MNRLRQGFTLLELIVVIAVIGILASITIIGFSQYQQDTRDARRASSINAIAEALEKYYDENGEYPSCSQMAAVGVDLVNDTLVGLDQTTVIAPAAPNNTTNSLKCGPGNTLTINGEDFFEYEGDGSTACNGSGSCLTYTLKYKKESSGEVISQSSRRVGNVAGAPSLTVTTVDFSVLSADWSDLANASGYTLQRASNSGFTTGLVSTSFDAATSEADATGLGAGQTYYFRVRAESVAGSGEWSATQSGTTNSLQTPSITTATAVSNSQINLAWSDVANETAYTLQYTTSSSSWSSPTPTTINLGANTTSRSVTGLTAGVTYYFRLQATAGAVVSGWSPNANATTFVPAPSCTASTVNNNRQITVSWSTVSVATSYTLQYATNSGFTSPTTITGITGTSRAVPNLNNGTTYYFRVAALNGSTSSAYATCPSATTGVDGPTSVGWSGRGEAVRCYTCVAWMPGADPGYGSTWWTVGMYIYGTCQPGATVVTRLYSYYAYSNNTSHNTAYLMDWTWGNQDRYIVSGSDSWYGWWQGWVACQVGSTRVGDTYLGNAGPY